MKTTPKLSEDYWHLFGLGSPKLKAEGGPMHPYDVNWHPSIVKEGHLQGFRRYRDFYNLKVSDAEIKEYCEKLL